MAITLADFNKIWASSSPLTPYSFSDDNYNEGWNFIGVTPPSRQMWDFLQKNNDEKMQYLANNYLPLSGGTMTGAINGNMATFVLQNTYANNQGVTLIRASSSEINTAYLQLNGNDSPNTKGGFVLGSTDGSQRYNLVGRRDGTLNWNDNPILTSSNYNSYALPLSGGTMTGTTIFDGSGIYSAPIKQKYDSAALRFFGGTDDSSANLWLFGKNSAGAGRFDLIASDGSGNKILRGTADGTLTWVGQNILTASNYNSYALPLSGGTMTGAIKRNGTATVVNTSDDSSALYFNAFNTNYAGSHLVLFGKDHAGAGRFDLVASDGTNSKDLRGTASGALTWGGQPLLPVGVVQAFAGTTIPNGWLLCDGSAVSRTTYANLYTCIGDTYGAGDGSTTFNLPDLSGESMSHIIKY